jgi:hypothetical protein
MGCSIRNNDNFLEIAEGHAPFNMQNLKFFIQFFPKLTGFFFKKFNTTGV